MTDKKIDKKFVVMSKFNSSDRYIGEKGFATREDADTYANLMIKTNEYEGCSYFLFEQAIAYPVQEN